MDQTLNDILDREGDDATMQVRDDEMGIIEVRGKGQIEGHEYALKPLAQLYGQGTGCESLDPSDERFLPLLMAIEETFVNAPGLTDGTVQAALDRLCMSPESDTQSDRIAAMLQCKLRLTLSITDFSRKDVRLALRKIKQSVVRHNKLAGPRGYVTFIREMLSREEDFE